MVQTIALLFSYSLFPVVVFISIVQLADNLGRASSDGSGLGNTPFVFLLDSVLCLQIASLAAVFFLRSRNGGIIPLTYLTIIIVAEKFLH